MSNIFGALGLYLAILCKDPAWKRQGAEKEHDLGHLFTKQTQYILSVFKVKPIKIYFGLKQ